ncbi:MAG: pyridoxine 5'-phosphate synthase [Bdellovibrionota bacterium]
MNPKQDTANKTRLGVNIDHVATLRRLRDTPYPDLLAAANACIEGGADQITVHLREDRRHIVDEDVSRLKANIAVDINLEMAATDEMLKIALELKPYSICVVPEKREERTTEGGLDLSNRTRNEFLKKIAHEAKARGIVVSFFIEPDAKDMKASKELGADAVELHTGSLCIAHQTANRSTLDHEWNRLRHAVSQGPSLNLNVHAGHGIDYAIAMELAKTRWEPGRILEYNIGHSIVCESIFCGLTEATRKMKSALTLHSEA